MVIVSWCHGGNSLTIEVSSVADMMGVGQGGGHVGQHSDIVGVASGVGVVNGESGSHLAQGVGIGLSLSLAVVAVVHSRVGGVAVVSIDSMADTSYNSDIVGVSSSIGVVGGESSSNLANSVGISLSLSLAVVSSVVNSRDSSVGVDSGSMGVDSSVTNSTNSRDEAMAVVNTSDDTAIGGSMVNLAQSVGVTADAGNEGKNLENIVICKNSNVYGFILTRAKDFMLAI